MPDKIKPYSTHGYLDVNDRHRELFGDCILLRDDDSMGFALQLGDLVGKYVKITIEEIQAPEHSPRQWKTDAEKKAKNA
jgi:hypothetical protein